MINPEQVFLYDASTVQLEEFLLFSICVAGKTARTQAKALHEFLNHGLENTSPFERIRTLISLGVLRESLEKSKLGQYTKLEKAYTQLVESNLDLRTCSASDLEAIHGVGFKTSRFFLMYTRPNYECAVLDTHILKYMRDTMGLPHVPKTTPGNYATYNHYEKMFIEHAKHLGRNIAELDLEIWTRYSSKQNSQ
jgi:thermostable 8-oxoguanine DNA glycosylase